MWELDHKGGGALKNFCFQTVVLEKILKSLLDCKEIKPVNPKGNQSWIFIGWRNVEAEAPILWPPDAKSWLIRKDPDAGKDWMQEKGMTEDRMVGWHHQLDGHEFEQALGDGEGQRSLVCCSPRGLRVKESDTTEWLNNNNSLDPERLLLKMYYNQWGQTMTFWVDLKQGMFPDQLLLDHQLSIWIESRLRDIRWSQAEVFSPVF